MKTPGSFNFGVLREDVSKEAHEKLNGNFPHNKDIDQQGRDFDKANRSVAMKEEKIKRIQADILDLENKRTENTPNTGEDVPFNPSEDIDPELIKLQKELIIAQEELAVLQKYANGLDPQVN